MADFFFKFRGWLIAPFGVLLLAFGKPSWVTFAAGLAVAIAGESIRIWGVGYAGKTTRKSKLDAPRLVTAGPFAYVRNPLYLGNACMGFGGFIMASGRLSGGMIAFLSAAFLISYGWVYGLVISAEEKYLQDQFGEAYRAYRASVPRAFPAARPYPGGEGKFDWKNVWSAEPNTLIPFFAVVVIMGLKIG